MTIRTEALALARRALRIIQADDAPLFLFSLTASEILQIADISRVSRDDLGELIGYQRPEVRQHIQEITEYLDGDQVLFPTRSSSRYRPQSGSPAAGAVKGSASATASLPAESWRYPSPTKVR